MKTNWWKNAVIYEIYCRSFKDTNGDGIGDLNGVIEKLPYLKNLGINCIWFTPIYVSPQVDNGYDVADYRDIDPAFGSLETFKKVLDEAHKLGIKIMMDMVLNHSSDECEWFKKSRQSKDNPYRDFYYWRKPKPDGSVPNNWSNYFKEGDGSAWEFDKKTGEYYLHLYSIKMPDLNWESPQLRKEVYSMMNSWLDMGVDGFRFDVICRTKKPDGLPDATDKNAKKEIGTPYYRYECENLPGVHKIIKDIRKNTWGQEKYDAVGLGEATGIAFPNDFEDLLNPENKELDLLYHFLTVSRGSKKERAIKTLKKMQRGWETLLDTGSWPTNHMSTHDQPRQVSKFGSERYRVRSAKALAMLNLTLPGTPILYQGEEIGMTNTYFETIDEYNDCYTRGDYFRHLKNGIEPKKALEMLRFKSRDNARTPMQWDESENAGFTTGKPWLGINKNYKTINVKNALKNKNSIFYFYKDLIELHKTAPALKEGKIKNFGDENDLSVCFMRKSEEQTLFITINLDTKPVPFEMPEELKGKKAKLLYTNLTGKKPTLKTGNLIPFEANIYEIK